MKDSTERKDRIYDCIGIGFGPSNIALAIAMDEIGAEADILFLERGEEADWQGEMAIAGSDIQHHPLRDFVTPRNPASPYGFLSYLKSQHRLFSFLNLDAAFPPRSDYTKYVKWVAQQFDHIVEYSANVVEIVHTVINDKPYIKVTTKDNWFITKAISFAPGRAAYIPQSFAPNLGHKVIHSSYYRSGTDRWAQEESVRRVAIVGASQSAVEIALDLPNQLPGVKACLIGRSFGIKQKDLSGFTEVIYEPEFVDYFHAASPEAQANLRSELWRSNYSAADHDVINQLHFKLYEQSVTGDKNIDVISNSKIEGVKKTGSGSYCLKLVDKLSGEVSYCEADAIILATGFMNHDGLEGNQSYHPLLSGVAAQAAFRPDGSVDIARDYQLRFSESHLDAAPIFMNGVAETTHGFGDAGSFSLLSVRSMEIARSLTKSLEKRKEADKSSNFLSMA